MINKTFIYSGIGIVVVGGILYFLISFLFSPQPEGPTNVGTNLGVTDISTAVGTTQNTTSEGTRNPQPPTSSTGSSQKIFKIADGPVSGATFIETKNPTTTLVRYVEGTDGHVVDLALDVPGAIPKTLSNTTIPGVLRTLWAGQGKVAILQYVDRTTLKTTSLTFTTQATSSALASARIQFFPDGIVDIALSPDGTQAAYLLRTTRGVDGYIANANGSSSKKVFSLPLSQILLSWPSAKTLLAQTESSSDANGIVFSIDVATGNTVPLLQATGLIATADPAFSYLVYQSTTVRGNRHLSYTHNMRTGTDQELSFSPLVEKCVWNMATTSPMYCASPQLPMPANYTDSWHMGTASMADTIFAYNLTTGGAESIATPGTNQGGVVSDVASIAVSPNGKYLLFVTKGDRSLWGVRLTQ